MKRVTAVVCVVLALAASASGYLSYQLEQMRGEATLEETALIATPKMARYASLGYTGLAADIYWTRAVQYFGGKHRAHSRQYQLLEPLLTLTTDLDPQLLIAYYFGAFFLSQKPPEGAGDPDAAVRLVERGIEANPEEWRLYYHLGMIHYMERKDFTAAAEAFERGSQNPNALSWMKVMAAAMRQRGGDIETARYLWTQIRDSTQDKLIKDNAENHLLSLRVEEDLFHLDEWVAEYKARHGNYPRNWADMVAAGMVRGVPADPTGAAYLLKGDHVEVRDARPFPFLERGRPAGQSMFDPVQ